jgi:release factor glutamine methyltransferase
VGTSVPGSGGRRWRHLVVDAEARLRQAGVAAAAVEARRIVEEVAGLDGAELVLRLDDTVTPLAQARWSSLVARRATGEPLQYVLGSWSFRSLDLFVDRRVLIPRPETEWVVEVALGELDRLAGDRPCTVVDLGTGSGAIALAIAAERWPRATVVATDRSSDALLVASANLAGLGRRGTTVTFAHGDWYDALPGALGGAVDLVVSNPPYVAAHERTALPAEIADWEPMDALVSGPSGLEAIEVVVAGAPAWLRRPGALVVEIGDTQAEAAVALASAAGFSSSEVRPDLSGRPRALVARLR